MSRSPSTARGEPKGREDLDCEWLCRMSWCLELPIVLGSYQTVTLNLCRIGNPVKRNTSETKDW